MADEPARGTASPTSSASTGSRWRGRLRDRGGPLRRDDVPVAHAFQGVFGGHRAQRVAGHGERRIGIAHAIAQRAPIVADAASAQTAAPLSPKQRGALARLFVLRWGNHVERVYDVKVGVWAQRMVPTLASADATNLRNALSRATFEAPTIWPREA